MTFKFSPFMVNQMSLEDCQALEQVEKIIDQFQKYYDEGDVLMSANDGEIIEIKELARVKGIISFIMRNRVVEVNPNQGLTARANFFQKGIDKRIKV